jgi:hypothetical protein
MLLRHISISPAVRVSIDDVAAAARRSGRLS